jgi:hypothetical protein
MLKTNRKSTNFNKFHYKNNPKSNKAVNKQNKSNADTKDTCYNCGRAYAHKEKCPAVGATCHSCGKSNHFFYVCRSKNTDHSKTNY